MPDLDDCSLSCYENIRDAQKQLDYFTQKNPKSVLACGKTRGICGLSQKTRERKKIRLKSHIDWWLYKDAEANHGFKEVTDCENTEPIF